ncbi:accessory gene regulator B family protein [Bacteroides acidifaciens]|uniref:accessory gene regulator ArgB-like protein n=1 Tax=Bacteroides acidifaciens TaxID=85831 RepID=UPI0030147D47
MDRIAKGLTDYVIRKGMIEETERNIYEYGFTLTMEVGLFVLVSLFLTLYLHMFVEGVLFFVIFAPLRSYAGGLHLEKYHSCFVLSCLTFSGILLTSRYIRIPTYFSLIAFFLLEMSVYAFYPVENTNREVDKEEDTYFRKKLKLFLIFDMFIVLVCATLKKDRYILVIVATFLMVAVTMILGKYKNKKMSDS